MGDVLVIGIAGGSGSGKTTLTNQIAAQLKESVTVIKHDDYYKAHDEMTYEERCRLNYDHPNAFDTELMIEHLKLLRQGRSGLRLYGAQPQQGYCDHQSRTGNYCRGNSDF